MLQIRPRHPVHTARDPYYGPHRDIAYIGQNMIHDAFCAMDDQMNEEWFQQWMESHGVTLEDLQNGAMAIATAMNCMTEPVMENLKKSGFKDLSSPAQAAIFIKLGQALLAAIHSGVRDVTDACADPPPSIQEMANTVRAVFAELSCEQTIEEVKD